jgi:hypothetical protein
MKAVTELYVDEDRISFNEGRWRVLGPVRIGKTTMIHYKYDKYVIQVSKTGKPLTQKICSAAKFG